MGTGARYERAAYGQALGEARAIQEHQLAMIPIMQQQSEMELGIRAEAYKQEFEQTKKLGLLSLQLQPETVLMPSPVTEIKTKSNYLIYAGLAALAYFFMRSK